MSLLRRMFGPRETVTSLYAEFYSRMQSVGETLAEYSTALIRLGSGGNTGLCDASSAVV